MYSIEYPSQMVDLSVTASNLFGCGFQLSFQYLNHNPIITTLLLTLMKVSTVRNFGLTFKEIKWCRPFIKTWKENKERSSNAYQKTKLKKIYFIAWTKPEDLMTWELVPHQNTSSLAIGLQSEFQQQFQVHILRGGPEPVFREGGRSSS